MKIKIDVEVTPQEFRTLIGLPDVAGLQEDVIEYIREKMAQGVDGFEAIALLKQLVPEGAKTAASLQKMLARGFGKILRDEEPVVEEEEAPKRKRRRKSDEG